MVESGGFKYDFRATKLDGGTVDVITFNVIRNNVPIARGSKRYNTPGFSLEINDTVTDEEQDTIYNQVATSLKEVILLSNNINVI